MFTSIADPDVEGPNQAAEPRLKEDFRLLLPSVTVTMLRVKPPSATVNVEARQVMSDIHLTKEFTTDERDGDTVSIALVISEDPDELWRRSFNKWITDHEWLDGNDGVILGFSIPFSYDGAHKIEMRTHVGTVEQALNALSATIDKVNDERTREQNHNPKTGGQSGRRVQAWFDRH